MAKAPKGIPQQHREAVGRGIPPLFHPRGVTIERPLPEASAPMVDRITATRLISASTPSYCGGSWFSFAGFCSPEEFRKARRGLSMDRSTDGTSSRSGRLCKDLGVFMTQIYTAPHIYTSVREVDLKEFEELFEGCSIFSVKNGDFTVFCLSSEKIYEQQELRRMEEKKRAAGAAPAGSAA